MSRAQFYLETPKYKYKYHRIDYEEALCSLKNIRCTALEDNSWGIV
jgi:hypothetical protein